MADEVEETTLETALEAVKREARWANRKAALSVSGWALSLFLAILGVGLLGALKPYGLIPLTLALVCLLVGALTSFPPRHGAIKRLWTVADARAIGPLLDLLPAALAERRQAILALLTHLLPQLQEQDAALLKPSHRNQLRTTLFLGDFWQEREYLIAVLKALERIGDSEDLAQVTRLATGQSASLQEQEVREAARACLPLLQEHIERQKDRGALLRPAFANSPLELLHPAIGGSDPDPTQLLRPNVGTPAGATGEDKTFG